MTDETKLQEVTVRMYRPGLGDCFLLTFRSTSNKVYSMLIDFGVLQGTTEGSARLRKIANDIKKTTGSHLNTVVATHEHWDHVSGFRAARKELFGEKASGKKKAVPGITVEQVWMAWTEDLTDKQVKRIRERNHKTTKAVTAAALGMGAIEGNPIRELLQFSGYFFGADAESTGGDGEGFLTEIMNNLRTWGRTRPRYLEPNDVITLGEYGINIYVLGPSRKMRMFNPGKPTETGSGSKKLQLNQATAFLAAALNFTGQKLGAEETEGFSQSDIDELTRLSQPFDNSISIPIKEAWNHPEYSTFFQAFYGSQEGDESGPAWRRIDTDWLQASEAFALQQVSTVNNTSLVLALELEDTGEVLLFPGDAELESWEMWGNADTNLDELLDRTILYKVGHHGSVNATPIKEGLEKMCSTDLVAMIPVDKVRASDKKWEFPERILYKELLEQTQGRVILNCDKACPDCPPTYDPNKFDSGVIQEDSSPDRLWVEYKISV